MKKIFLTIFIFVFVANVSAQLKVNSSGETHVAKSILLGSSTSFLGTTSSSTPFPLTFKVNNVLAGSTGTLLNSNVSFGYQALNSSMGSGNVAVGSRALYFNTSTSNTANGFEALYSNLNGASNTANVAYALDELQKSDDPKINAFNDSLRNARSPEEKAIDAKARAKKEEIVYSGFIAQDVEAAAQSLSYDFSGVDAPENGNNRNSRCSCCTM